LISQSSKGVFLTKASFQYGFKSILPGTSRRLTIFGESLSRAFLKHGWVDKG